MRGGGVTPSPEEPEPDVPDGGKIKPVETIGFLAHNSSMFSGYENTINNLYGLYYEGQLSYRGSNYATYIHKKSASEDMFTVMIPLKKSLYKFAINEEDGSVDTSTESHLLDNLDLNEICRLEGIQSVIVTSYVNSEGTYCVVEYYAESVDELNAAKENGTLVSRIVELSE